MWSVVDNTYRRLIWLPSRFVLVFSEFVVVVVGVVVVVVVVIVVCAFQSFHTISFVCVATNTTHGAINCFLVAVVVVVIAYRSGCGTTSNKSTNEVTDKIFLWFLKKTELYLIQTVKKGNKNKPRKKERITKINDIFAYFGCTERQQCCRNIHIENTPRSLCLVCVSMDLWIIVARS